VGEGKGPRYLAWSCNLQSQPGAQRHAAALAGFVREHFGGSQNRVMKGADAIPKGSRFSSIAELVEALAQWLDVSHADRLGEGGSFGGTPWLVVETPLGRMNVNADTRRDAIASLVSVARHGTVRQMQVSANRNGRLNKVTFDGCQQEGWYAYLQQPLTAPRRSAATGAASMVQFPHAGGEAPRRNLATGAASIVQFPHPGGEHVPRDNLMAWNTAPHRRKFLKNPGSIVRDDGTVVFQGPLTLWGEWEPPSTIKHRWEPEPGLPTVLHEPRWEDPGPPGRRQNTDPWVFGPNFLYSNCKQLNPTGTPSAMQRQQTGSVILFGSSRDGEFVLDTVFVVADVVVQFRPLDGVPGASRAFNVCTARSLAAEPPHISQGTFTLFRGATPQQRVNGMFSFVPCRRWATGGCRFARPAVRLSGIINPLSWQAPSGAKMLRKPAQVARAWADVVKQVTAAGLELGVDLLEPPLQPQGPP
jgi:hypothetical protein